VIVVPCSDPRGFDVNLWAVDVTTCLLFPAFLVLPFFNSVMCLLEQILATVESFFPFLVLLPDDFSTLQPLTHEA
jgi:hypothetical protein